MEKEYEACPQDFEPPSTFNEFPYHHRKGDHMLVAKISLYFCQRVPKIRQNATKAAHSGKEMPYFSSKCAEIQPKPPSKEISVSLPK